MIWALVSTLLGEGKPNYIQGYTQGYTHGQASTRNQTTSSKFYLLARQAQHNTGPAFLINELTHRLPLCVTSSQRAVEGKQNVHEEHGL